MFNTVAWHAVSQQCEKDEKDEKDEKSGTRKPRSHELRRSILEPSRQVKERKGGRAVAIEPWDPFRVLRSMRKAMDHLFRDSWGRPLEPRLPDWGDSPVDVAEKEYAFVVRATIPGVRPEGIPEDIPANVREDRLTLRAESQNVQRRKDERYDMRERYSAAFYRALTLPSPVNTDQVDARYDQGMLSRPRLLARLLCGALDESTERIK